MPKGAACRLLLYCQAIDDFQSNVAKPIKSDKSLTVTVFYFYCNFDKVFAVWGNKGQ